MTIKYVFEKIQLDIRKRILSGEWNVGSRLPSSRDFARQYSSSVNTVEKAIKELTAEGLLKRDNRRGTFVGNGVVSEKSHNRSGLVAAIVVGIENPLWASALRGIEDIMHLHGVGLLSSSDDGNFHKLESMIKGIIAKKVDGLIMCPILENEHGDRNNQLVRMLSDNGIKLVYLDRYDYGLDIPYVSSDNARGAYNLTRLLISKGHRKILFVRNSNFSTINERFLGFRQAFIEQGLPFSNEFEVMIPTKFENFAQEFDVYCAAFEQRVKDLDFTAVFTANDQIAEAVIASLERLGYKMPEDISLVTYEASNLNMKHRYNLTGMDQPFYNMGQTAAKQLLNLIEGKEPHVFGQICKSKLNEGNSVKNIVQVSM